MKGFIYRGSSVTRGVGVGKPQPSTLGLVATGAVTTRAQRESVLSKVHSKANRDGWTPVEKQQAVVKEYNTQK